MPELIQVGRILCAAAFTVTVCSLIGKLVLARLRPLLSPVEESALSFVIGAALLSTLILALGVAGIVGAWQYLLLALLVAVAWFCFARRRRPEIRFRLMQLPVSWLIVLVLIAVPYGVFDVVNALAPESSADGTAYHLGLIARYASEGRIVPTPANFYSGLSQGVEMLFLYAFVLGRHSAAALVHLAYLFALALLILTFGLRHRMPVVGMAAAVLVFVSPIVGFTATLAYIDVAVACTGFACLYLLTLCEKHEEIAFALCAGILAGFCFGSKYSAVGAIPLALLVVAWSRRRSLLSPRTAVALATVVAGILLTAGPWLLRNTLWYQNPVAPFYNRIFPSPMMTVQSEEAFRAHLRNWGNLPSKWDIPLEVTVRGQSLQGFFGPIFLLSPLALLALGNRTGRRMLLAALFFGVTYYANLGTRFLIPALPFLAVALAISLQRWRPAIAGIIVVHAILSWPSVAGAYCDWYSPRPFDFPLKAALRLMPEETFLASRLPEWPLVEFLNTRTSPGERVFSLGALAESYIDREIVVDYYSAFGENLRDMLLSAYVEERMPTDTVQFSFPATSARTLRLGYEGPVRESGWGVSEIQVLGSEGQPLDRGAWTLSANPNPFHSAFAVDRNPITRWQTWQPVDSSMRLDMVLESAQPISGVVLVQPPQHSWMEPLLSSSADGEAWEKLQYELRKTSTSPDVARYRADAVRALRDAGMSYLAVREGNFLYEELRDNAPAWGLTEVHRSPLWILYQL